MADTDGLIWVRALTGLDVRPNEHRVVLFERDDRHPGGEAFVFGPQPKQVFETTGVVQAIRNGDLEKISEKDARAALGAQQNAPVSQDTAALDARAADLATAQNQLEADRATVDAERAKLDADRKAFEKQQKEAARNAPAT